MKIKAQTGENKAIDFRVDQYGTLWFKKRFYVSEQGHFKNTIIDEAHNSTYSIILEPQKCTWIFETSTSGEE
jgi:hypothetical protein